MGISPSQGLCLHTGPHRLRRSCRWTRGNCDRHKLIYLSENVRIYVLTSILKHMRYRQSAEQGLGAEKNSYLNYLEFRINEVSQILLLLLLLYN
jgi:hypothetical protein